MTTITNTKANTQITWHPAKHPIFTLTRVWTGPGEDGTLETSQAPDTPKRRDEEIAALLRPLPGQLTSDWTLKNPT